MSKNWTVRLVNGPEDGLIVDRVPVGQKTIQTPSVDPARPHRYDLSWNADLNEPYRDILGRPIYWWQQ